MADPKAKAFDVALEWSKQAIAIASGTLVLSGTFLKDILRNAPVGGHWLVLSWLALLASIILGVLVMMAMVAALNKNPPGDVYAKPVRLAAIGQALSFLCGMICFTVFVVRNTS